MNDRVRAIVARMRQNTQSFVASARERITDRVQKAPPPPPVIVLSARVPMSTRNNRHLGQRELQELLD